MKTVFLLEHSYEISETGEPETKFIGVYSCKEYAEQAIERLLKQPGFKEFPDYFNIDEIVIDQDHWEEGFVTETYEPKYSVWRKDESGNVYLVKDRLTEIDAFRLVRDSYNIEPKQFYWAKEIL